MILMRFMFVTLFMGLSFVACNDSEFASKHTDISSPKPNDQPATAAPAPIAPAAPTSTSTRTTTPTETPVPLPKETLEQEAPPEDQPAQNPECGRGQAGLFGKVYQLKPDTKMLPKFESMTPIGKVDSLQLDVPTRSWLNGFPNIDNLVEWFAISFQGILNVPEDGTYAFKLTSDDGANLYLNDTLIVNNDGIHSTASKESQKLTIKKGKYRIKIDWYQGPRDQIALQLFWKTPGQTNFAIIPSDNLEHVLDCTLKDLGSFP